MTAHVCIDDSSFESVHAWYFSEFPAMEKRYRSFGLDGARHLRQQGKHAEADDVMRVLRLLGSSGREPWREAYEYL